MSNPKKSNVLINSRTVVHKESGGVLITTDVCLTKIGKSTVPITYTNTALSVSTKKSDYISLFMTKAPVFYLKTDTFPKLSSVWTACPANVEPLLTKSWTNTNPSLQEVS